MIDERTEELAALYGLDLLEPAERRAFEARLEAEPELRKMVDDFQETAAAIAHAAPPRLPGVGLEARILEKIREDKIVALPKPNSANVWLPWAIAACLALACIGLYSNYTRVRTELAQAVSQNELGQVRIAALGSKLTTAPEASAVVVWDPVKRRGMVRLDHLPAPEPGRDYQLWIIDPNYKQPISAGVIQAEGSSAAMAFFAIDQPISEASKFAVSVERTGGAPAPEGPIIFISK